MAEGFGLYFQDLRFYLEIGTCDFGLEGKVELG